MPRAAVLTAALVLLAGRSAVPTIAGAAAAPRRIELVQLGPAGDPAALAIRNFASQVERDTDGRLTVQVRFASPRDAAASVQDMMFGYLQGLSGNLDNYLPLMIDEVSGLEMPFLLAGVRPTERYLASPLLAAARHKVLSYRHIRFLEMIAVRDPFHVIASRRPISSPADLAGLRLASATPITDTAVQVWRALGVTYVPLPLSQIERGLAAGNVDAVVFPDLDGVESSTVRAVAPYVVAVHDCPQIWQISINETVWRRLDGAEQQALLTAARESARLFESDSRRRYRRERTELRSSGARFARLDARAVRLDARNAYVTLVHQGWLNPAVLRAADAAMSRR